MKVQLSPYLSEQKGILKKLIEILSKKYQYVSILGCDSKGKNYSVTKGTISVNDSTWSERGFVLRVYNGIGYSEFSFNELPKDNITQFAEYLSTQLDSYQINLSSSEFKKYPVVQEDMINDNFYGDVEILPESVTSKEIIKKLTDIMDRGSKVSELIIDYRVRFDIVHISKLFLSSKKELEQAYVWSQAYLMPLSRKDQNNKYFYKAFSGLKGVEIIDELYPYIEEIGLESESMLNAVPMTPGTYDIICSPDVTGLIAHEAFGHGVEMDMFVKSRAKAAEYIDKPVASKLVTMHEGAKSAHHVSSYLFDDEGVLGTDTIVIDKGILKTGISDLLSALQLGTTPTGNGKRQSYERKAYARMTNTVIASGNDKLEDMIASIEHGYILLTSQGGMEDPKNWGIQCMMLKGVEIIDGKLTDKIISPIIMTGYVPELLSNISMVSADMKLGGSGMCGKGYKEFVKNSSGGPYIKTKARLG
ncbi:MAG: putative Zn-dependent protease-like protein [Clostridia bacterium]|nr:putative Zn-dependent protease-like protein [Clostridia bacterium]